MNDMAITETIELSKDEIEEFDALTEELRKELIREVFARLDERAEKRLFVGYCSSDRESYDAGSVIVNEVAFEGSHDSGSMDVSFTGSTYMGCRDIDIEHDHDEVVTFRLIRECELIEFATAPPDHGERTLDDI